MKSALMSGFESADIVTAQHAAPPRVANPAPHGRIAPWACRRSHLGRRAVRTSNGGAPTRCSICARRASRNRLDVSLDADPSHAQTAAYTGVPHLTDFRDPLATPHVCGWAMHHAGASGRELRDLGIVEEDGVGEPHVLAQPTHALGECDRPHPVDVLAIGLLVQRLRQVGHAG